MITKEQVEEIINKQILGNEYFLVDINVQPGNIITVLIDKYAGITIDECVAISHKLELLMNREKEDFELNVSSPGINKPFKVLEQYIKNIGRLIEIIDDQGQKYTGKLLDVKNNTLTLEKKHKKNKNKENIDDNILNINLNNIKRAKESI